MAEILVNKVANSGIITINLEDYFPKEEFVRFDLKDYLFKELILKEKEFRALLKEVAWESYNGKIVLLLCSNDAIIPMWAYMLVAKYLGDRPKDLYNGDELAYLSHYYDKRIEELSLEPYSGKMVVLKGCGDKQVPAHAYQKLTSRLTPVVKSLMYGEPCSTVPIYKMPKK